MDCLWWSMEGWWWCSSFHPSIICENEEWKRRVEHAIVLVLDGSCLGLGWLVDSLYWYMGGLWCGSSLQSSIILWERRVKEKSGACHCFDLGWSWLSLGWFMHDHGRSWLVLDWSWIVLGWRDIWAENERACKKNKKHADIWLWTAGNESHVCTVLSERKNFIEAPSKITHAVLFRATKNFIDSTVLSCLPTRQSTPNPLTLGSLNWIKLGSSVWYSSCVHYPFQIENLHWDAIKDCPCSFLRATKNVLNWHSDLD